MNCVKDHITKNFQLLAGTLSPAEALARLVDDKYGVVLDEHSKPVALVMADDLERAKNQGFSSLLDINVGFPPTIIVGCLVDMQDLVKWESLIKQYEKIRGAIAINDNTVIGILPVAAIAKNRDDQLHWKLAFDYIKQILAQFAPFLENRNYQLRGNVGSIGDSSLGGKHQLSKCYVRCAQCDFPNELSYIDWNNLPDCQNSDEPKHKLKLS